MGAFASTVGRIIAGKYLSLDWAPAAELQPVLAPIDAAPGGASALRRFRSRNKVLRQGPSARIGYYRVPFATVPNAAL